MSDGLGWMFDKRFGRNLPGAELPPRFYEYRSRTARPCELGCVDGIAKGDTYRIIRSTGQRACLTCWADRWPPTTSP